MPSGIMRNFSRLSSTLVLSARRDTPHICALCQARVERLQASNGTEPRRQISSTSRRPQQRPQIHVTNTPISSPSHASYSTQSDRSKTPPVTHYDFFPETFPNGPPPHAPFTPDLRQLRREFLQLQAKAHPDLAPADQKRHAEALSMRINEAYKTLQDPLRRAQYLLQQAGLDPEDESAKLSDSALLMEVMEAREAVDEVAEESELDALRAENAERIKSSVDSLEKSFAEEAWEVAAQEAIRLRYWMNIEESIAGWEKGLGGGLTHH